MRRSTAGRRPGAPDTRAEILQAARLVFAANGYDRATVRAIAAEAGVDPAMIHHFFGTKEQLFVATIDLPMPVLEAVRSAFEGNRDRMGERLATVFFMAWQNELARTSLLGILRSAMSGEDRAVDAFRQFLTSALLDRIAPLIEGENARLRAVLMASHMVGIAVTRYVVRLEPIASASVDDIITLVAPRIQSYVDD
ncbi:MAG TPA: TetR family transcriptional regulator [Acidimicrobiia bacterium]|nr:TetR family transcriptional regulator [Acidimicrobiia bacterium]